MRWSDSRPEGVLHIPSALTGVLVAAGYDQFETGHTYHLPMAVGIAVTLSMLTYTPMYLTGDLSVWTEEWAELKLSDEAVSDAN
ncbi:hypothetical protein [Devosia submarina]|uniref:hypothetical protein n=1 Tax=Devosia submarina TaxID=1173082 RepID=UPI0013004B3C|nr:hypothetical protein [Devosia submarina]